MKVALIGDVHANLHALESVLAQVELHGDEEIWNLGDLVGYGAFPEEVVQRLRTVQARCIAGNFDRLVLQAAELDPAWLSAKPPELLTAIQWAHDRLSPASRRYLAALPAEIRFEAAGKSILLVHGSPASIDEHLRPTTPVARLRELAALAEADLVICGHSHQPFVRQVGDVCFINTGSVERPDDGDPRATYALLTLTEQEVQVAHHRVAYDFEAAAAAVRSADLPEAFAQMLLQGRGLGSVIQQFENNGE